MAGKTIVCDLYYRMAVAGIPSISELQRKTDLHRLTLDRLLNNESQRIDYSTMVKLCEVLGCNIEELFIIVDESVRDDITESAKRRREEMKRGVVYFVKDKATDLIKIGRTANVNGRIRSLEVENKTKIELLFVLKTDNTVLLEKETHEKFTDYNIHGEWFRIPKETLNKFKEKEGATSQ